MDKPIALFAYDFAHRKSQDFITELLCSGRNRIVVLGAPRKVLSHHDRRPYFASLLQFCPPLPTEELCKNIGIPYHRVEHGDICQISALATMYGFELAIIAGARIIPAETIGLFRRGVINLHPGRLPDTSGLDSFYYTIKSGAPAGVTAHFIDHRVDAGRQISFDRIRLHPSDTPETVIENIYQLQRMTLRNLVDKLQSDALLSTPISRPIKNLPMSPEEKIEVLACFDAWKARQFAEQQISELFIACEVGDESVAARLVRADFRLISHTNSRGWTPLIVACFNQQKEVVKFLLANGADPNRPGVNGTTPLMYAKTKLINQVDVDYEILDILIRGGADIKRTDALGKTILEYVLESGDTKLASFLQNQVGKNDAIH